MPDINSLVPALKPDVGGPEPRQVAADRAMQWLAEGWRSFMAAPGVWLAITVVFLVIQFVLGMIPIIGALATAFLNPVLIAGLLLGCRSQAETGQPLQFETLFAGFRQRTGELVMLGVLALAGAVVLALLISLTAGGGALTGVLLGGGAGVVFAAGTALIVLLLALILAIPYMMALWFAPALVALSNCAPVDAVKRSLAACLKNWLPLTVYGVVVFVLMLVAMLPLGLGLLVLIPVLVASMYASWRDIFA